MSILNKTFLSIKVETNRAIHYAKKDLTKIKYNEWYLGF